MSAKSRPSVLKEIRGPLQSSSNFEIAEHSQRFFKTGPGEYRQGDQFINIHVPILRKVAKQRRDISFTDMQTLLRSPIDEQKLLIPMILISQYQLYDAATYKQVFDLNW